MSEQRWYIYRKRKIVLHIIDEASNKNRNSPFEGSFHQEMKNLDEFYKYIYK